MRKVIAGLLMALLFGASQAHATTYFSVSGGKIFDPDGNQFIARGLSINDFDIANTPVSLLQQLFPRINYVRVSNFWPDNPSGYAGAIDPTSYSSWVTSLTSKGIVVQFSDYPGQNASSCRTGADLTNAEAWYKRVAAYYASNPYVWFESQNECGDPSGTTIGPEHVGLYNAVRAVSGTMFLLNSADGNPNSSGLVGINSSNYTGMTNVVWDIHFYGWAFPACCNQSSSDSSGTSFIGNFTAFSSLDGTIPVILGEDGNATSQGIVDGNGAQTMTTVLNMVAAGTAQGFGYWEWYCGCLPAGAGDQITSGGTNAGLNGAYGTQVANAIATAPGGEAGSSGGGSSTTSATTWDANSASFITLDGTKLVATATGSQAIIKSTTAKSSGKFCAEVTANTISANWDVGFSNASFNGAAGNGLGGDNNGIAMDPNSGGGLQGIFIGNMLQSNGAVSSVNGEAVTMCFDLGNSLFWATTSAMRGAGNTWNNSPTANPATGTGGISTSALTCPCYVTFNEFENGVATLNTPGPFAVATPTGFSAWDSTTVQANPRRLIIFGNKENEVTVASLMH